MAAVAAHAPRQPVPTVFSLWRDEVEQHLQQIQLPADSLLSEMISYHMGWIDANGRRANPAGKRVRPQLCCWAAAACAAPAKSALPAACAVELVHNFTLIHDDVQDGDRTRHGRPTVWSLWGEAQAIAAGDALFALALHTVFRGGSGEGEAPRRSAAQVLLDAVLEVAEGQSFDLAHEGAPDTPVAAYLRMVECKTGALLGASLEAGAVMAGADAQVRMRMRTAGRLLGIAYQLRDDWLGVWGDSTLTGKSRHSDLVCRKLTHPVVAAYEVAEPRYRQELLELYGTRGTEQEARIRQLLEERGTAELTATAAAARAAEAVAQIRQCGLTRGRLEEFADVAEFVANRNR